VTPRQCACGCGEPVVGRGQTRFVSDTHRQRAGRRRRLRWVPGARMGTPSASPRWRPTTWCPKAGLRDRACSTTTRRAGRSGPDVTDSKEPEARVKALVDSDPDAARGVACQRYAIP
jgi:hypothetical protein